MLWKMLLLNLVPKPHRKPFFYSVFLGRARRTWGREQLVQLFCFYSFFPWYFYQDLQLWEIPSCLLDSINILALSSELKDTVRQESFLLFSSSSSVAVYEMPCLLPMCNSSIERGLRGCRNLYSKITHLLFSRGNTAEFTLNFPEWPTLKPAKPSLQLPQLPQIPQHPPSLPGFTGLCVRTSLLPSCSFLFPNASGNTHKKVISTHVEKWKWAVNMG